MKGESSYKINYEKLFIKFTFGLIIKINLGTCKYKLINYIK